MRLRSCGSSSRKDHHAGKRKRSIAALESGTSSSDSDYGRSVEEYRPDSECDDRSVSGDGSVVPGDVSACFDLFKHSLAEVEALLIDSDYESPFKSTGKRSSSRKKKNSAVLNLENEDANDASDLDVTGKDDRMGKRKRSKAKRKRKERAPLMWEIWEEGHERWLDENMMKDAGLDKKKNEVVSRTYQAPSDLVMPLIRYQQEWLAWALEKEESATKGGILADEMGMGKTIQAIALVLAKRDLCRNIGDGHAVPSSSESLPEIQCTLVICPVVAVTQWVSEIDRFTTKGSTKVLIYHGANRAKKSHNISDYDFVITTYSIVEFDYRKNVMPPKKKCQYCGRLLHPEKMDFHLKYFCGPGAVRTEKQSKQSRKKTKATKKSSGRKKNTTGARESKSILHSVKWQRIVLDEAHFIKERRSNTAKAILSLESSYKWALSGTPLQNRIGELYSLIRFLRVVPYSYYFCKTCDCRKLDARSATDCPNCPHKFKHFCWWNRYVAAPVQSGRGRGERAMFLLKNKILKEIVLRRTKIGRSADLALPPTIITVRRDLMDIQEEDFYQSVYSDSQARFSTYVEQGTVTSNYANIFELLTRLRQAVDHPYLVVYSRSAWKSEREEERDDAAVPSTEFSENADPVSPTAGLTGEGSNAPQSFIRGFKKTSILNRVRLSEFRSSTKIEALREEIQSMLERDGSAKAIVFSQFTSFLDLINYSLEKSGLRCVRLVGSMSIAARNDAIAKFTDDPGYRIFLMSLKAGGVALNLTVASHVFLMDPWWNPAVERQAQDRIHRIGQYKPIRVVKFIIKNTVEERILRLQEKKELVFEGTVGGSSDALGRLTVADMRFLFTM